MEFSESTARVSSFVDRVRKPATRLLKDLARERVNRVLYLPWLFLIMAEWRSDTPGYDRQHRGGGKASVDTDASRLLEISIP